MVRRYFILFAILLIAPVICPAQDQPSTKVHGYVFGDYFYKFAGDSSGGAAQYASMKKDDQGFQFRRLYLYVDHTMSERFASQFLLEGTDKSLDPGGRLGIYIKTAFVEWKDIVPLGNFQIGLILTPTWSYVSEKIWNYRSVEKTIADFRGLGLATDIGASLRGKVSGDGLVSYHVMIGNGNGQKPESNKFKKYYGSVTLRPTEQITVDVTGDYEPTSDTHDKSTLKAFASYHHPSFTAGIEAVQQLQLNVGATGNRRPMGITLFAWAPLSTNNDLNGFVRYDFFNNDANQSSSGFNEQFITAGLDYMPVPNLHFMPNVWMNTYSDKSPAALSRDGDLVARLTFFFVYK